jgi:hypothetical protein
MLKGLLATTKPENSSGLEVAECFYPPVGYEADSANTRYINDSVNPLQAYFRFADRDFLRIGKFAVISPSFSGKFFYVPTVNDPGFGVQFLAGQFMPNEQLTYSARGQAKPLGCLIDGKPVSDCHAHAPQCIVIVNRLQAKHRERFVTSTQRHWPDRLTTVRLSRFFVL